MKNFTFARKWHEVLKSYSEDIQKEVYRAAVEYAFTGNIIEMQPLARMAFDFIRYEIDEKERRREARLAKKQQNSELPQPETDKIADNYLESDKAPKPFTVQNGGIRVTMSRSRIRTLAKRCVHELIENGRKPYEPNFSTALDSLVRNRYEVIRQDLTARRPTAPFSEELWDAIILDACRQFRA